MSKANLPSSVVSASWLLPSGGDDTAAINAAIAVGHQLGVGTFKVDGLINGCPRGQGSALTILQATSSSAGIQHGNALGSDQPQTPGTFGGFAFNGEGEAGATTPLFTSNVEGATYIDLEAYNSAGDAAGIYGQNCLFLNCVVGACPGRGLVLDQGCGGNVFFRCEIASAATYGLEVRQSIAAYTGSAYAVPTNNYFYGCIFEGGDPDCQANVHVTNSDVLVLTDCQFSGDNSTTEANILVEQTGLAYGFPNFNAYTYVRNCSFTSVPSGNPHIKSGAGDIYGSPVVVLQGDNTMPNATAIEWNSASPMRQDGTIAQGPGGYTQGSGAAALEYAPYSLAAIRSGDTFEPPDIGLKLTNFDPEVATAYQQLYAGLIYLVKVNVPANITVANLLVWLTGAGASLTAGECWAGIYDSDGNLWAKTADQSTAWETAGLVSMALTAQTGYSLNLAGGEGKFYWIALLVNGTTAPSFASSANGSGMPPNIGYGYPYAQAIPGAVHRYGYAGSGYTSLLSLNSVVLTDAFLTAGMPWVGVI